MNPKTNDKILKKNKRSIQKNIIKILKNKNLTRTDLINKLKGSVKDEIGQYYIRSIISEMINQQILVDAVIHFRCPHCTCKYDRNGIDLFKKKRQKKVIDTTKYVDKTEIEETPTPKLCSICTQMKHCNSCEILLRTDDIIEQLEESMPKYKLTNNISSITDDYCNTCKSKRHVLRLIKKRCRSCNKLLKARNSLKHYLTFGNFCQLCIKRVNLNISNNTIDILPEGPKTSSV